MTIGLVGGAGLCALTFVAGGYDTRGAVAQVAIGSALGLFINPDADQDGRTHAEALLRRIPGVGFLFQWLWYGYAMLFRHRGWSHHIVVGTISRWAWSLLLLLILTAVAVGIGYLYDGVPRDWLNEITRPLVQAMTPTILFAWWVQDALHILADLTISAR